MESPETRLLADKGALFFSGIWMSRDPGQAFHFLVAERAAEGKVAVRDLFGDVLPPNGRADVAGAVARAAWLAERLGELPPEDQRKVVIKSVSVINRPNVIGNLVLNLADESIREEASAAALKTLESSGIQPTLEFLGTSPDVEWRIARLAEFDPRKSRPGPFSEEAERNLRVGLAGWKLPQDRIDAIVGKFRDTVK